MIPDVNVLVAAFRADHPHHLTAAAWLKTTLRDATDGQKVLLSMHVLAGFLRIVTNPKVFLDPTPSAQAMDFVDWLLEDANAHLVDTGAEWSQMRSLIIDKKLVGNQIPDAQLAALALKLGEPFVTFDKGFRQLLPRSLLTLITV
jgi:uncharacterized protein